MSHKGCSCLHAYWLEGKTDTRTHGRSHHTRGEGGALRGRVGPEEWGWEPFWGYFAPPTESRGGAQSLRLFPSRGSQAKAGCLCSSLCRYDLGRVLRRALNTNQMKAVAAGAWEQGAAPGACGWITLYNYNTAAKAPEPEWRWVAGGRGEVDAGFPSAQPLFGSEWISSVWVGAYCCVYFSSSLPFVLSLWPERLLKEQRGSPCGRENCEVAIIQTRRGIIGIRILLGHCGN